MCKVNTTKKKGLIVIEKMHSGGSSPFSKEYVYSYHVLYGIAAWQRHHDELVQ